MPEIQPLKSILKNSRISKDAYYHDLSEAEFDAKVKENTKENQKNKPTIKNILKKHDNFKIILKQAQEMADTNTSSMPNHKQDEPPLNSETDKKDNSDTAAANEKVKQATRCILNLLREIFKSFEKD